MNINSSGGKLAMLLTQDNGGTRLSSTRYVYYGTITATRESDCGTFFSHRVLNDVCSEDWSMGRCCHSFHQYE